ncbi:MAG: hypothetical protein ACEQSF_00800 [Solirubrobacteraceae bacterium]
MKILKLILIFFYFSNGFLNAQILKVFNDISILNKPEFSRVASDKFKVKVKFESENQFKESFVGKTTSKKTSSNDSLGYVKHLSNWSASWSSFEFSGDKNVVIEVSKFNGESINKIKVRPEGAAIKEELKDGKAYITINKNVNFNVDIDGQMEDKYTGMFFGKDIHTISIFANPIFKVPSNGSKVKKVFPGQAIPAISEGDTLFFQKGVHRIKDAIYTLKARTTVYIPGDALVHGAFKTNESWDQNASNDFVVYGPGTLSGEEQKHFSSRPFQGQASGIRIEGILVIDAQNNTYHIQNLSGDRTKKNIYKNLKTLNWRLNSDGINAFNNSEISDCFLRCQDDVFYYGFHDVVIKNCTTWNDVNGSVIVFSTSNQSDDSNASVSGINVIYHRRVWHGVPVGRVINMGGGQPEVFKNVYIKDLTIEDPFPAFAPFSFTFSSENKQTKTLFKNIVFENIKMLNKPQDFESTCAKWGVECKDKNYFYGANSISPLDNITLKNFNYLGKIVKNFKDGNFLTNNYIGSNNKFLYDCNLNLINANQLQGKIFPSAGNYKYTNEDLVTLTAKSNYFFKFNGWVNQDNKLISKANQYTFKIQDNITVKSTFKFILCPFNYDSSTKTARFKIDSDDFSIGNINIYDFGGKKLFSKALKLNKGENDIELNSLNLTKGFYIARIFDGVNTQVVKFLAK